MKKILIGLGVLVVLAGAVVTWWTYEFPSATWRYKITVEVETPEGIKMGSAVREVHVQYAPTIGDIPTTSVNVKGEAVVIDLGERGVIFSTISGYDILFRAFPYSKGGLTKEGMNYYSQLEHAQKSLLKLDIVPQFLMFKNLEDPFSVKQLDVLNLRRDFGAGVNIKDIIIETTNAPVTWGIVDRYLPWLKRQKGGYLGGGATSRGAPLGLHTGYFQTGVKND